MYIKNLLPVPPLLMSVHLREKKKKKERNREYINIYTHIYILKLAFQTKIFLPSDQHTLKYLYLCLPPTEELGEIKTRNNVKTIRCSEKAKHSL